MAPSSVLRFQAPLLSAGQGRRASQALPSRGGRELHARCLLEEEGRGRRGHHLLGEGGQELHVHRLSVGEVQGLRGRQVLLSRGLHVKQSRLSVGEERGHHESLGRLLPERRVKQSLRVQEGVQEHRVHQERLWK